MSKNIFFKSNGPFKLDILFPNQSNSKIKIKDIKTLDKAEKLDLTFFDSLSQKRQKLVVVLQKKILKDICLNLVRAYALIMSYLH